MYKISKVYSDAKASGLGLIDIGHTPLPSLCYKTQFFSMKMHFSENFHNFLKLFFSKLQIKKRPKRRFLRNIPTEFLNKSLLTEDGEKNKKLEFFQKYVNFFEFFTC